MANSELIVRGGDAKKEQGNSDHNVPGDILVQGDQGCGGDNSDQRVQYEGENVANSELFVQDEDAKKAQGNGGHNVPGDRLIQGSQGCDGEYSDQTVQSIADKNVQNSANMNVHDEMYENGVHDEQFSGENSEEMVQGEDMEKVQGNSEQNVPLEVSV